MKQRAHAEVIKAWADGEQIEFRTGASQKWKEVVDPAFLADYEYRVKPAEPERVYPKTGMTLDELHHAYGVGLSLKGGVALAHVANVGLRHAIDNGQVVTREEFDRVSAELKAAQQAFHGLYGEPLRPGMIIKVKA